MIYDGKGKEVNIEVFYNAVDYGLSESSEDNTNALQTLIDTVSQNGGGVIWVPTGTYIFDTSKHTNTYMIMMQDNVSIIGESLNGSVFKLVGNTQQGKLFMVNKRGVGTDNPMVGCIFANMTYDASETTSNSYSYLGKCFMFSYVKDCVWKDLRLIGFIATALGIDLLDNVTIDSVYCYQCGKGWSTGGSGGAGIGIGTGTSGWDHENFVIRNCICEECGHFGIFLEDQGLFTNPNKQNFPKGQIIANNIVHGGKNYGIGVRGGRFVNVIGNNIYSNAKGGIYLDYGADRSFISGNIISNEINAICFGDEGSKNIACTRIAIQNNMFAECTNGIIQTLTPTDCVIQNNITIT